MFVWAIVMGCGGPGPAAEAPRVMSLVIEPAELLVNTGPDGAEPVQFVATATYSDGTTAPLDVVEWTLSNRSVGTIDETGLFTASSTNGGVSWVKAQLGPSVAFANLTVIYDADMNPEGIDPSVFDGTVTTTEGLWTYPEDGVNIPRNTPSLQFQWANVGAEAYRLHFQSDVTDLTVYTTSNSWTADNATWTSIVSANAGGEVWVDLWAYAGGQLTGEAPIRIQVNRMDADGSIYYWSTSNGGLIMEIPYGQQAVSFLGPTETGRCVACHAISKDGLIAFTYDGGNGNMGVKQISDKSDVIPYGAAYANFMTFSPDGKYLLGCSNGKLHLWDAQTGAYLWEVVTGTYATHPDWSPDGTRVAFTQVDFTGGADWSFSGESRIAVMEVLGDGTFGPYDVVAQAPTGRAYYPSWSPDGQWIAFNISTGDAYDDVDAEVWVVSGDGGPKVRLDQANLGPNLTNSWPRWAPLPDDDVLWVTFASKRPYGNITAGNPQIWVAAFDPERAADGVDPSWPAFWLPGQDTTQNNHIPVWAE